MSEAGGSFRPVAGVPELGPQPKLDARASPALLAYCVPWKLLNSFLPCRRGSGIIDPGMILAQGLGRFGGNFRLPFGNASAQGEMRCDSGRSDPSTSPPGLAAHYHSASTMPTPLFLATPDFSRDQCVAVASLW